MGVISALQDQWRRMIGWGRRFDRVIAQRRSDAPGWRSGDRVAIDGMRTLLNGRTATLIKQRRLPSLRPGWLVELDEPFFGGGNRTTVADTALRRLNDPEAPLY